MKGAIKDTANPYFKSKYADLASVWEACREPLSKNNIAVIQPLHQSEKEEILLETVLMHSSGQWVSSMIQIPVTKADAQGYGSALTYARRYGLSAMVGVAPEDDDGNAAAAAKSHPLKASGPITPTTGAWDSMSNEQRYRLLDISIVVIEYLDQGDIDSAKKAIDDAALSQEEKVALWTKFDSKQRAALKKQQ